MNNTDFITVFVTTRSAEEAETIARHLVEEKLAACVNIVNQCTSIYYWKGKVEREGEVLMLIKTAGALFARLAQRVNELHSYDVPEIVAVPLEEIAEGYLGYLIATLASDD
jgi:periplasmic divalent cation tolerance protein